MRIIPVLDLMGGQVVRGVGGRRKEYRPVVSRLTASSWPLDVARAFRQHFGLTELYVADLDAIAGGRPSIGMVTQLRADGFRLWVDAGVREAASVAPLVRAGVDKIVVGLETVAGPAALTAILGEHSPGRIAFSLDLNQGVPLGDTAAWTAPHAEAIADQAVHLGVRHMIVLDLARVGVRAGTGTEALCRRLATAHADIEMVAGGGVRGREDLQRLHETGAKAALVASALHDGTLTRTDTNLV